MTFPCTCAVLLAAGLSQRMGEINKLLIPVGNKPMVRHVVEQYVDAGISEIVVVVGYQQERIRNALDGLDVKIVFNENFSDGQITSIRCGLTALPEKIKTVLIGLSDQPLLTASDLQQLLSSFLQQSEKSMLVPHYQGVRGNPIVLSAEQALAVDSDGIRLGCRKLIDRYPDKVFRFEATNSHFTCDLDTANEVKELLGDKAISEVSVL
ncbi:nucleotidyltransferase family protein [Alteromonas sp. 5E99-2]|uniref:nucleotidyltransferase family protein n=1 Tax=Alteromonas sp. 5E99-2 TaxID=2817683 RepID=UPI001A9877F7|nr:nucleotidyltransferase family protein [Alteromonas sp. 5E99-2]MBO1256155.1 nucleotidyltransferase family protein [Alteromonas sp. 5E99-2]